MKTTISIHIDSDVAGQTEQEAQRRNMNRSEFVEFALRSFLKDIAPQIIHCTVCGGRYSDKLPECPSCVYNKQIKEVAVADKRAKIDELIATKKKIMTDVNQLNYTINRLEIEGRQPEADKYTKERDVLLAQIMELEKQIDGE